MKAQSFQKKVLSFLIIILATNFLITFFMLMASNRIFRLQTVNEFQNRGILISEEISNHLLDSEKSIMRTLNYIEQQQDLFPYISDKEIYFDNAVGSILSLSNSFENIMLLDNRGIIQKVWPEESDYLGLDMSRQHFYISDPVPGIPVWSDSFVSNFTGNPTLAISILSERGLFIFFLNLLNLSDLTLLDTAKTEEFIAILDSRGTIVAHSDPQIALLADNLSHLSTVKLSKQGKFGVGTEEIKGIKGILSSTGIEQGDFSVVQYRPNYQIYGQINRFYLMITGLYLLIMIIMSIATLILTRSIRKPINKLNTALYSVASGSYDTILPDNFEEFNFLVSNFNHMSKLVQIREKELGHSLKEQEILLSELQHRTKNTLQVILSIVQLQEVMNSDKPIEEILQNLNNRIRSITIVHERLYTKGNIAEVNLKDYIKELAESLLESYNILNGNIQLNLDIEDIYLLIDIVIPCGLIINELITNTIKYAFPDTHRNNSIDIRSYNEGDKLILEYKDNGVGIPSKNEDFREGSLGFTIIKDLAVHQLNGEYELIENNGFACRFLLDLSIYKNRTTGPIIE